MGYNPGTPELTTFNFEDSGVSVDPTTVTLTYVANGTTHGPLVYSGASTPGVGFIYRTSEVIDSDTIITYSCQIPTAGFTGDITITWASTGPGTASLSQTIEQAVNQVRGSVYSWAPGVDDVGAILRARTINQFGSELGTFNSTTRPTDVSVITLINQACADVQDAIGPTVNIPAQLIPSAMSLAALGTAMMIEIGFYPEQINSGRSPYPQLATQYTAKLKNLQNAIVSLGGERPTDESMTPFGAFGGPPIPLSWWYPQL
jgi:hypothetical protein